MRRIGPTPTKTVPVATATFTLLVPENEDRVYLEIINDTASNIYIAATNIEPNDVNSATNGMQLLNAGQRKIFEEPTVIVTSAIYVYQTSGGNLNIKYNEGQ